MAVLSRGEKVIVVTRRRFESDIRRHFAGEVEAVEDGAFRVRGYAFVFDETENEFVRRRQERTRIFSVLDSGYLILVLPPGVDLGELRYHVDETNRRSVTDGGGFSMNISEFSGYR